MEQIPGRVGPVDFLEVNGRPYACDLAGNGPGVVLLHAALGNRHMYDHLFRALAPDHLVLAYDQPGFGDTPLPPGGISPVFDLLALMDAAGMEQAVLVGTSFGSRVAFDAALAAPQHIRGIVAAGPGLSGRQATLGLRQAQEQVDRALQAGDIDLANELEMRIWVDGVGRRRPPEPRMRAALAAMNRPLLERELAGQSLVELPPRRAAVDVLESIACPVLVIVGANDQPHCLATAAMIETRVPGARVVTLAETGHVPSMERPEEFSRLVREFLAGLG